MADLTYSAQRAQADALRTALSRDCVILSHTQDALSAEAGELTRRQTALKTRAESMQLAAAVLQQLVDEVGAANISRLEHLVNSALRTVFHDLDLQFRIVSEIKRNTNSYRIVVFHNGVEGSTESFGGGVYAVIALVLKILFNILAKRYPLLVLDESLAMVSEQYISRVSQLIKELSAEFSMPILLVTHQPGFAAEANRTYEISLASPKTAVFNELKRN